MNPLESDKFVPTRAASPSPPPPLLPPRPRGPELRRASRAAGATIFGDSDADGDAGDDEFPPSYEASTVRRPSDAHIHITVRSSRPATTSASSSLPSLIAHRSGRTSINTQGYLLTTPMNPSSSANHNNHPQHRQQQQYASHRSGGYDTVKEGTTPGCIASDTGGCCFSHRRGCFFSDREGCFFGDTGGCCCSDTGGCCFSSNGGTCFSEGGGAWCCSKCRRQRGGGAGAGAGAGAGEMAGVETTMHRHVRYA